MFDIQNRTILLVVAGSHAYGMATKNSDIDVRGMALAPFDVRLSNFKRFEQYEGKWCFGDQYSEKIRNLISSEQEPSDIVIYDIAKAIKLIGENYRILCILFKNIRK